MDIMEYNVAEWKSQKFRFISSFGTLWVALGSQVIHVGVTVIITMRHLFNSGT